MEAVDPPVELRVCEHGLDHPLRAALSRSAAAVARLLARSAGVRPAAVRWEFVGGPTFDNQVAILDLMGRGAHLTIEKTSPEDWATPRLHRTLSRTIA